MKSRITKWAAAAMVVAAIGVGVYWMGGEQKAAAAIDWRQVVESMQKQKWMVVEMVVLNNGRKVENGGDKSWFNFAKQRCITKTQRGMIIYMDLTEGIMQQYDEKFNKITQTIISEDHEHLVAMMASPYEIFKTFIELFERGGANITTVTGKYEGREVEIIRADNRQSKLGFLPSSEFEFCLDRERKLPLYIEENKGDGMVQQIKFEYPEQGPEDIYQAGAPRTAEFVNLKPSDEISKIKKQYLQKQKDFTKRYGAVVYIEQKAGDKTRLLSCNMIYRDGKEYREDSSNLDLGISIDKTKEYNEKLEMVKKEMGGDFESMRQWWLNNESSYSKSTKFNIGEDTYWYKKEKQKEWKYEKGWLPEEYANRLSINTGIAEMGWWAASDFQKSDNVGVEFKLIEDDYSRQQGLLALEITIQGYIRGERDYFAPQKLVYYLNPQRDYICQRYEVESKREAVWQKDKNWAKDVNIDITSEFKDTREVLEYGQTPEGQWYPKVIATETITATQPVAKRTERIYLETRKEFPAGIFDVQKFEKENGVIK